MDEDELTSLVGRRLPGGSYTIEPYVNWLVNDIVEVAADEAVAHPLFAYVASARGKGISWDEVFEMCGAQAADGPMFGEHETELFRPLVPGETLQVAAAFTSAERKSGKRTGTFDIVGFEVTLTDDTGRVAARTYNSIVFPRRNS